MSKNSIEKGARWSPEISKRLGDTSQAIVCVTRENQSAEWLNFEAGALAKATDSRVRTLLVDITPADVTGPLSEFQHTLASNKEDVRELMASINNHCERPLTEAILDAVFEREWPAFEAKVDEVSLLGRQSGGRGKPRRSDSDILAEILDRVRTSERTTQEQSSAISFLARQIDERMEHDRRPILSRREYEELRLRDDEARRIAMERQRLEESEEAELSERLLGQRVSGANSDGQHIEGVAESVIRRGSGLYVRVLVDGSDSPEVLRAKSITVHTDSRSVDAARRAQVARRRRAGDPPPE